MLTFSGGDREDTLRLGGGDLFAHVPQQICQKIWSHKYMNLLLKGNVEFQDFCSGGLLHITEKGLLETSPKAVKDKVTTIEKSTDAFNIFTYIYFKRKTKHTTSFNTLALLGRQLLALQPYHEESMMTNSVFGKPQMSSHGGSLTPTYGFGSWQRALPLHNMNTCVFLRQTAWTFKMGFALTSLANIRMHDHTVVGLAMATTHAFNWPLQMFETWTGVPRIFARTDSPNLSTVVGGDHLPSEVPNSKGSDTKGSTLLLSHIQPQSHLFSLSKTPINLQNQRHELSVYDQDKAAAILNRFSHGFPL